MDTSTQEFNFFDLLKGAGGVDFESLVETLTQGAEEGAEEYNDFFRKPMIFYLLLTLLHKVARLTQLLLQNTAMQLWCKLRLKLKSRTCSTQQFKVLKLLLMLK